MAKSVEEQKKEGIKVDDLVSVPFGGKFLCGVVKIVTPEKLTINNYVNNDVLIPNNKQVYKFFPGQKFDIREFERVDENTTEKLSLKEKLNKFLSKTEVGSFSSFMEKNKGDLVQLLKGQLTNNLFNGSSIIKNEKGADELKNWACKFQLYRGQDGNLKLNTAWKQEQLQTKVYGVELTPEQKTNMIDKKQSVVIDRVTAAGVPFKAFCKFDQDLNSFVTSQHDVKIEERMKLSYAKKEDQGKAQETAPEKEASKKKGRGV